MFLGTQLNIIQNLCDIFPFSKITGQKKFANIKYGNKRAHSKENTIKQIDF